MSISGQEQIQIGAQNSPTMSDSLWVAFNKTQNNFARLFSQASTYNTFIGQEGTTVLSNAQTGTVTIKNTGVLNLFPGTGISLSSSNGNIVISASGGSGTTGVTSVGIVSNTMTVANTPIVSSGNISINLPSQANVVPGEYVAPTFTVDQYGRITDISSTTSSGTVTSVSLTGGSGIEIAGGPITTNGSIRVTNSGVTKINAGAGISVSSETGVVTVSLTNPGGGSTGGVAAGNTGELQFNLAGTFSANPNISYDSSNNILSVGNVTATGDMLPSANVTYDLGSPTKRWRDLYLSTNSLVMGDTTLSVEGGSLTVNGNPPDAVFESLPFGEGSGVDWVKWQGANLTVRGPNANVLSTLQKVGVGMKIKLLTPPAVAGNTLTTTSRLALTSTATPGHYEYTFSVAESSANLQYVYSADVAYTNTVSVASDGNIVLPGSDSSITYTDGSLAAPQIIGVPANATANGVAGQTAFDSNYMYICVATNTWKRAAISTW